MAARMNDAEGIMWAVESDPFLRTDFTNITLLEWAPDPDHLRPGLERAIDGLPPPPGTHRPPAGDRPAAPGPGRRPPRAPARPARLAASGDLLPGRRRRRRPAPRRVVRLGRRAGRAGRRLEPGGADGRSPGRG